jgi:hypothetical protein
MGVTSMSKRGIALTKVLSASMTIFTTTLFIASTACFAGEKYSKTTREKAESNKINTSSQITFHTNNNGFQLISLDIQGGNINQNITLISPMAFTPEDINILMQSALQNEHYEPVQEGAIHNIVEEDQDNLPPDSGKRNLSFPNSTLLNFTDAEDSIWAVSQLLDPGQFGSLSLNLELQTIPHLNPDAVWEQLEQQIYLEISLRLSLLVIQGFYLARSEAMYHCNRVEITIEFSESNLDTIIEEEQDNLPPDGDNNLKNYHIEIQIDKNQLREMVDHHKILEVNLRLLQESFCDQQ